jgi:PAS domain S-box-containing protein
MKKNVAADENTVHPRSSADLGDLAQYKSLYDHAPVGYCLLSETGIILNANYKAAAILEIERDALLSQRLSRFVLHEAQEEFYRLKKRLEEDSPPESLELWMVRGDGSPFWAHLESRLVRDELETESSWKIHLVISDATARHQMATKLCESSDRFKYAIEATREGLWDLDLKTQKVFLSSQWLKLVGYQDEKIADHVDFFFSLVHPEDLPHVHTSLEDHLQGKTTVKQLEIRLRHKSGEYRWFFDKGEVVSWDAEGYPDRMVGTIADITKRKRAEAALQESEFRWKFAIEGSGDGLWDWDIVTGKVFYSTRWKDMLGYAEHEIGDQASEWEERVHPEDQAQMHVNMEDCLDGRTSLYRSEQRLKCKDGSWKWILARGVIVSTDSNGRPARVIGTLRDVSARKEANDALRASEERYRRLFEKNPQPMWVYDVESLRFLAVNEMAINHYGYSHQEFLEMTILEIIDPEELVCRADQAIQVSVVDLQQGVWRHMLKNGEIIQVDVSSHSLEFASRKAQMVLAQNITERLTAEKRIRQQATLLDKAQDAILVHDLDHKILYWNSSAERIYQWTAAEALDQSVERLLYSASTDVTGVIQTTLAKGEWVGEMRQTTKNGDILTVEGRWTLLHDERGIPDSILAIYTDITARKKLEQHFLRAQRMESIGTLASGIAHDLNNVLAPIMMSIELLKSYLDNPRGLEILDLVSRSTRRGADMVSQVLSFARGAEVKRVHLHVERLLLELVSITGETFPKNILIKTHLDAGLWSMHADPTQLHQVLLNLCVNARDAMPDGGEIHLRASNVVIHSHYSFTQVAGDLGRYLVLEVEDTGVGMSQEILENIFDPFFTTKAVGKGTGLGLATAMMNVKNHGGFIRVYSELGKGSRFLVYIPAVEDPVSSALPTEKMPLSRGNGELILIVDDEEAIREVASQSLQSYGYRVMLAENGAEALKIFQEAGPAIQLVITDMMMPIMDGLTLIKCLKHLKPDIEIIAASGNSEQVNVTEALYFGVCHFLDKPYSLEQLLEILEVVFKRNLKS